VVQGSFHVPLREHSLQIMKIKSRCEEKVPSELDGQVAGTRHTARRISRKATIFLRVQRCFEICGFGERDWSIKTIMAKIAKVIGMIKTRIQLRTWRRIPGSAYPIR
jgi:hypothetical protein